MAQLAQKHILIVDDDPSVLRSLARYLKKKGYRVSEASGGRDAIEKVEKDPPHLVLLDVVMPDMDGIETLNLIRQRFPDVDVVMISALKEEIVAKESIKMGAYEWLPKPFSLETLETTIFVTLMRRGLIDGSEVPILS